MKLDQETKRFVHHGNAFGFLRLVMASAVIVSHACALLDGDGRREPFLALFNTVTLGEVAVDGFFAISGFLITGSYLHSRGIGSYLLKRVTRIYPGFIVATLICILVVAPLGGADLRSIPIAGWMGEIKRLVLLATPGVAAFPSTPFPLVNGSMWTILYEFRCYLLLIPLGAIGALRRPGLVVAIAAGLLGLAGFAPKVLQPLDLLPFHATWFGDAASGARLYGIFLSGAAIFLLSDRIAFTKLRLAMAAVLLVACFFVPTLPSLAFGLFGSYLVLGIASLGRGTWMETINNRNDISYGVYLYAWPITKLLTWYWPTIPLAALIALTFVASLACGWLSWHGVERPVLQWVRQRTRPLAMAAEA